jgi:hypothetical protein
VGPSARAVQGLTSNEADQSKGLAMRKQAIGIVVACILVLDAGTALAGDGPPPVTVSPNPVRQSGSLEIIAADCVSGDGWEAFVEITIESNADGAEKHHSYAPADSSGTTKASIKIKKSKYPKGEYLVTVDCIHEFDEGGTGVWYASDHPVKVKKPKRHG